MRPDWLNLVEEKKVIYASPEDDIQDIVIDLILSDSRDLSGNLIIYPGRRPQRYLIAGLAKRIGASFFPPKIISMEDFVSELHYEITGYRQLESYEAISILHDLCVEASLLPENLLDFSRFYPFGQRILFALEELLIELVPLESLKNVEALLDLGEISKRSFDSLSRIYGSFYKVLDDRRVSTRAMRYAALSAVGDLQSRLNFERIIFAGFFALTHAEKKILSQISKKDGFIVVFKDEGSPLEKGRKVHLYSAPQVHEEVRIVGKILRSMDSLDNTVIVVPRAESLFPLLRQGLSFLDEGSYNVSLGYPIWRTPIFSLFMKLFAVIERAKGDMVYIDDYLRFLLHPYIRTIELKGSSDIGRRVVEEFENQLRRNFPQTFVSLKDLEGSLPDLAYSEIGEFGLSEGDLESHLRFIHDHFLRPFFEISSVADFFKRCRDVLLLVRDMSSAKYHPLFYPYASFYLREFEKVSRSILKDRSFSNFSSYSNLFKRLISSVYFPFEGGIESPLQILGFLETRCLKFEKVIIMDLNEGVVPDLSEDYILPLSVRAALKLPSPKDREKLIGYYLNNLICCASEIHMLYLERDDMPRSRFIERLVWEFEKEERRPIEDKDIVRTLSLEIDLSNPLPPPREKSKEIMDLLCNISLSPTGIDDYKECGIRFFLRYVLGLRPKDYELFETGRIVHLALKRFFEKMQGKILKVALAESDIETIVDEIFLAKYGSTIDGRGHLLKRQIKRRLREFIDFALYHLRPHSAKINSVEEYVEEEFMGMPFSFRIDLVLEREGRIEILDFKTSSEEKDYLFKKAASSDLKSKLPSLQVPLYILLYAKRYNLDPKNLRGYYILLGKKRLGEDAILDPFRDLGFDRGLDLTSSIVEKVIEEIKDPKIPFSPPLDPKSSCELCQFKVLCGTSWIGLTRELNLPLA